MPDAISWSSFIDLKQGDMLSSTKQVKHRIRPNLPKRPPKKDFAFSVSLATLHCGRGGHASDKDGNTAKFLRSAS